MKCLFKKMGLSKKFLRHVIYINKEALGLGLMRLNTILSMQLLKLHVGHVRRNTDTSKIMNIQRENASAEKGLDMRNIGKMQCETHAKQVRTNRINKICKNRYIEIKEEEVNN